MTENNNNYTDPGEREKEMNEKMNEEMAKDHENSLEENVIEEKTDNLTEEKTDFQKELEESRQKYDELNDNYLRLHAEFDNFRKRTLKEKAELIRNGGERVLLDIISLVDDFERALSSLHAAEDKDAMLQGIDLIYTKFINFLKQHGVKEIESVGQPFDADRFEAVTTIPAEEESQKGIVIDCIQKGYELNDKIIRFPKVIVGE